MLNLAAIFTTSGVLLFYKAFDTLKFDILDCLIQNNLAKDKSNQTIFIEPYRVMWMKSIENNLFFVIVFQELLQIDEPDYLLNKMKQSYLENIYPNLKIQDNTFSNILSFDEELKEVLGKWQKHILKEKSKQKMQTFYDTDKGKELKNTTQKKFKKEIEEEQEKKKIQNQKDEKMKISGDVKNNDPEQPKSPHDEIQKNRDKLKLSQISSPKKPEKKESVLNVPVKRKKEMATAIPGKISSSLIKKLDKSAIGNPDETPNDDRQIEEYKNQYFGGENDKIDGFIEDSQESSEEETNFNQKVETQQKRGFFGRIANQIKSFTGNKTYDQEDLEPVLSKFKDLLMSKNVAEEIAQKLFESVNQSLLNTQAQAFTSISKIVKDSLSESIAKILTPKRSIDLLADALRAKEKGKPYVVAFIGVNGVGKSTNLAKVAYMYKNQGLSVMLAACDNFRAGAVEQIKTHGRCLGIPVYDKGYRCDPADIAFDAIRDGTMRKVDVILIDTAGRMQDNEPLMKSLARLVKLNNPDLILFIGEALVGNDGLDQLNKFNKALIDLSDKDNIREIDGILLSKFDTVDDKVGAALSMTYSSGKPIVYVGVGQKYIHLKKLNVKTIVHALLQ